MSKIMVEVPDKKCWGDEPDGDCCDMLTSDGGEWSCPHRKHGVPLFAKPTKACREAEVKDAKQDS